MFKVRQIYYKDLQRIFNMNRTQDFEPLLNPTSDKYLESGVIRRMYESGDYVNNDYYGVVSHKFYKKIHKSSEYVLNTISEDADNPDVYSFFSKNPKINLITQGQQWHELYLDIYKIISERLEWDIDLSDESHKMEGIFSNHWIANIHTFKEYCQEYLIPVMDLMEDNKLLRDLCSQDVKYINDDKLSPEECLKVFKKPYYTYHCFILERLFPLFCYLTNKTVKHI